MILRCVTLGVIIAAVPVRLAAQADSASRAWNQPIAPFRIAGNLYYVGAHDISAFLLTSPAGHIVIDGGFEETAPQVLANIERLGFRARDVKVLLNSHGHNDHAGGLAALKRATGATLVAAPGDADLIERGGRGDFAWGDRLSYEAATVDRRIGDGEEVRVGPLVVRALITPGHTRGCTTWTTTVRDAGVDRDVAIVCSLTAPGYQLRGNTAYPRIVADYESSFRKLAGIHPAIFLSSHAYAFDLHGKIARLNAGDPRNPFIDAAEFPAFLARAEQAFRDQLAHENGRATP